MNKELIYELLFAIVLSANLTFGIQGDSLTKFLVVLLDICCFGLMYILYKGSDKE